MKWIAAFGFVICILHTSNALTVRSVFRVNFIEEAHQENFNSNELELLKPIIEVLQAHYDRILTLTDSNKDSQLDNTSDINLNALLSSFFQHLEDEEDTFQYNVNLPTVSHLEESFTAEFPSGEAHDMENILQENLDDALQTIQAIVVDANKAEAMLISINKIKILKFIYKQLGKIFMLGARASRAAYCTYSNIPQINSTLTEGRKNIGSCYVYTRDSVKYLRNEVQSSIDTIRGNVVELVAVYKKIASRESLLGKLFTVLMNVSKIRNDISETRSVANKTIQQLKTDVPTITANTKECATTSIPTFANELNRTITELVTCINFVDDSTWAPEPEPETEEDSEEEEDFKKSPLRLF